MATLDQLSNGRFLFGIGYGWNHEEMENHGVDITRRRKVVREKILACKALWTEEEAAFSGEYVNFEPSWAWPKPVQQPHPPIVVGASPTELHFRHIVEYGDVWMPIEGRWPIAEGWAAAAAARRRHGRDPATLRLGVFGAKPDAAHLAELRGCRGVVRRARSCRRSTATKPWSRWIATRRSSRSSTLSSTRDRHAPSRSSHL